MSNHVLSSGGFWIVNKQVARATSNNAALLIAELINVYEQVKYVNKLGPDGSFFKAGIELDDLCNLSPYERRTAQGHLERMEWIKVETKQIPGTLRAVLVWLIDFKKINEFLQLPGSQEIEPPQVNTLPHSPSQNSSLPQVKNMACILDPTTKEEEYSLQETEKDILNRVTNSFALSNPSYAKKVHSKQLLFNSLFDSYIEAGLSFDYIKSNMKWISKCLAPTESFQPTWHNNVQVILYRALTSIDPTQAALTKPSVKIKEDTKPEFDQFAHFMKNAVKIKDYNGDR